MSDNLWVNMDAGERKGDSRRDHRRDVIERASEVKEARRAERDLMLMKPDEAQRMQLDAPDFPDADPALTGVGDIRGAARLDMDLEVVDDTAAGTGVQRSDDGDLDVVDDVSLFDEPGAVGLDDW